MRLAPLLLAVCSVSAQSLQLEKTIELANVDGRLSHLAVDVAGKRLFVAATGNNSVEVIDTDSGKFLRSITGVRAPQGLFFWPESNRLYVSNGATGSVEAFDGVSLSSLRRFDFNGGNPENIRFGPKEKEMFVGFGDGALGVVNLKLGTNVGATVLEAHPGGFELEREGYRVFVNIPSGHVTVIDRRTRGITSKWPLPAKENFPLALDEDHHRLYVGCRKPAQLLVLNSDDGKIVGSVPIVEDADDMFWDASRQRLYVVGGGGEITLVQQTAGDQYAVAEHVRTAKGARTGLFVPEFRKLYVAVPRHGREDASVLVFRISD